MPHHEYTITVQAKLDALNKLIEQQSNRIAELERLAVDAYEAWQCSEDANVGDLLRLMT